MFRIDFQHLQEFITEPITHICISESCVHHSVIEQVTKDDKYQSQVIPKHLPLEWFVSSRDSVSHPFELLICPLDYCITHPELAQSFSYLWLLVPLSSRADLFSWLDHIHYDVKLEYEREEEHVTEVFCGRVTELTILPNYIKQDKLERLFHSDPFSKDIFKSTMFSPSPLKKKEEEKRDKENQEDEDKPIVLKMNNPFLPSLPASEWLASFSRKK